MADNKKLLDELIRIQNIEKENFEKFKKTLGDAGKAEERLIELEETLNKLHEKRLSLSRKISFLENKINDLESERVLLNQKNSSLTNDEKKRLDEITIELQNQNKKLADTKKIQDENTNAINDTNKQIKNTNVLVSNVNKLYGDVNSKLKQGYTWLDKQHEKHGLLLKSINQFLNGGKKLFNDTKSFLDIWGKSDQAASNFAKKIGLSKIGMDNLRKSTIGFINSQSISAKYNKSIDELIKLQGDYSSKVGRSISLTDKQRESLAAISSVVGDDMAVDLASKLENFGISMSKSGDIIGKIFSNAAKKGIAFDAYARNFTENIKIAQNYTFENGIKGLASMAEKATAIKLNMSQAVSFADKVSSIEGAVKASSQLQVLGGPFSQYANPLSMLYESLNDMEGLQNRIVNMFGRLGRFNKRTGEMEISSFNKMRIRQAAEATGMDYTNLIEMIQANGKRNAIGDLTKFGFTKNEEELIYNKAFFNEELKKWGISDENNNFKAIEELKSGDNNIKFLESISKTESEDIKEIAKILRGWNDSIEGMGKQYDAIKTQIAENTIAPFSKKLINELSIHTELLKIIAWGEIGKNIGQFLLNSFDSIQRGKPYFKGRNNNPSKYDTMRRQVRMKEKIRTSSIGNTRIGKSVERFIGSKSMHRGLSTIKSIGRGIGKATPYAIGGLAVDAINDSLVSSGVIKKNSTANKLMNVGGSSLSGAATGALIGNIVPIIGPGIGAAIGAAVGGISGHLKNVKARLENEIDDTGYDIKGSYNRKTLKKIKEFIESGDSSVLREKDKKRLIESGEYESLLNFVYDKHGLTSRIDNANMNANNVVINTNNSNFNGYNEQYANGGLLRGPLHSNGGMPILGTNKSVEGGEFIVNRHSTKKYFNELNRINSDSTPIKPIEPLGKIMKVSSTNLDNNNSLNKDIKINPIDINLSGTIKLDIGNKNIDITDNIINNQTFINTLTNMITKQININSNGGFVKDKYKQLWK